MRVGKITDMTRGWMIGNFEPSLLKTELFEVAVLLHPKGQIWPAHYHRVATEYNLLILLFLEDINEAAYRIDRMLSHLNMQTFCRSAAPYFLANSPVNRKKTVMMKE